MSPERIDLDTGYFISSDRELIDLAIVQGYLAEQSYWAKGRSAQTTATAVANSVVLGAFISNGSAQVGFARLVTDQATFAWLCDVFVLDAHKGNGLGKALVAAAVAFCDSVVMKRMILATDDAHGLYDQQGFRPLDGRQNWMFRNLGGPGEDS